MSEVRDYSSAVYEASEFAQTSGGGRLGWVRTKQGVVGVRNYPVDPKPGLYLYFVYAGRQYNRSVYGRPVSDRYTVTLAKRFAREVVETVLAGDQSQMAPAGAEGG